MKEWFQGLVAEDERDERVRLRPPCLWGWLFIVALFAAGIATCAHGQVVRGEVEVDCDDYAAFAGFFTTYRDADAKLEKLVEMLRARFAVGGVDPDRQAIYLAELRRMWHEGLSREEAAAAAHKRCTDQLGSYPRRREG